MLDTLKILRPVGNVITTKPHKLPLSPFSPFLSNFYQSGTASLAAAIIASHKRRSDIEKPEVIVPAYGCPDLISAVVHANATPVLVDLEPNSPRMDLTQLEDSITGNTTAIIAVRFFGIAEQNEKLDSLCKKYNLTLIEDSAQGFPVLNVNNYWHGDFIILSFGRGKPINLLEGGAVLSRNCELMNLLPATNIIKESPIKTLKQKLKLKIYNQSIHPLIYGMLSLLPGLSIGQTVYKPLEAIAPISELTSSLLVSNLAAYQHRKLIQIEYNNFLNKISNDLIINLPEKLNHPIQQPLLRYPILIKDISLRNTIYEKLKNLGASKMYQQPLLKIDKVGDLIKHPTSEFPNATQLANHLVTLPTHEGVSQDSLNKTKNVLRLT